MSSKEWTEAQLAMQACRNAEEDLRQAQRLCERLRVIAFAKRLAYNRAVRVLAGTFVPQYDQEQS